MHTNLKSLNRLNGGYERITLCGTIYWLPNCSDLFHQLTLEKLTLDFDVRTLVVGDGSSYFAFPSMKDKMENLSLYIESEYCLTPGYDSKVAFFLFREGNEYPIMTFMGAVDSAYENRLSATNVKEELSVGRYFLVGSNVLLGANAERFCYVFDILPSGAELVHPQLKHVELRRKIDDVRVGQFTSGGVRLYLQLDTPLIPRSELRAACYSEDWIPMATGSCYHPHGREVGARIGITLRSERIWLDGNYFVVISHNEEPCALLKFCYDGAEVTSCMVCSLDTTDTEYMLVKQIEPNKDLKWEEVGRFQGMAEVKPRLIQSYCRRDVDTLCLDFGIDSLRAHHYAVVSAPNLFYAERLAEVLPRMLHYGTSESVSISCRTYDADEIKESFLNAGNASVVLYDVEALTTPDAASKLYEIEGKMKDCLKTCNIIFLASDEELERLCRCSRVIREELDNALHFELAWPSVAETVDFICHWIREDRLILTPEAENVLVHQVKAHYDVLCRWEWNECRRYVRTSLMTRLRKRMQACLDAGEEVTPNKLLSLHPTDIDLAEYVTSSGQTKDPLGDDILFCQSMAELNAMVGLDDLKEQLSVTFAQTRFQQLRSKLGLPTNDLATHHMLFTGNPGTGKTTVARLIGKVFHAMGYLSKGEVICTDRKELVGKYIGYTEDNMCELLKKAKGNVLFIDEAYTLCDSTQDRKDFGYHVIEALLPIMAEPHPDMVIIFAGYSDEMERLMKANQGLKGRFAHHLHFEDYTADELLQICNNMLEKYHYTLTDEAYELLVDIVHRTLRDKDAYFCNARWIKQFVESGILPAMARRVMQMPKVAINASVATAIEAVDVQIAARKYASRKPMVQMKPRIGFVA